MERMVTLVWRHPLRQRITEVVCAEHEQEVLTALRTLGIAVSIYACTFDTPVCGRCRAQSLGREPRLYLGLSG